MADTVTNKAVDKKICVDDVENKLPAFLRHARDIKLPSNPVPVPNEKFCIYQSPASDPQYLTRYGVELESPDPFYKPIKTDRYVWSVFDLEDLGFKVFLDGSYNYKIGAGVEKGVVKRFQTSDAGPEYNPCRRTIGNLWFLSYRKNQLPSEYLFWPTRPRTYSNIPDFSEMTEGQRTDVRDAQRREQAKLREAEKKDQQRKEKFPLYSVPRSEVNFERPVVQVDASHQLNLRTKYAEVRQTLADRWLSGKFGGTLELRQPFDETLKALVGDEAIMKLKIAESPLARVLQKRDSLLYQRDLETDLFWTDKPNNAATKITRAYFGLPVEPLTAINIANAGLNSNDPWMEIERDVPSLKRALAEPLPLDFLDEYTESLRGVGSARKKPNQSDLHYKTLPREVLDVVQEDDFGIQREALTKKCGTRQHRLTLGGMGPYFGESGDSGSLRGGALSPFEEEDMADGPEYLADDDGSDESDSDSEDEILMMDSSAAASDRRTVGLRGGAPQSNATTDTTGRDKLLAGLEPDLPVARRSDRAIKILLQLQGQKGLLDAYERGGKLERPEVSTHFLQWVADKTIVDVDRMEILAVPKTTEKPNGVSILFKDHLERIYEYHKEWKDRSTEAQAKCLTLASDLYPEHLAEYTDANGVRDDDKVYPNIGSLIEVLTTSTVPQLLEAGGSLDHDDLDVKLWKHFIEYDADNTISAPSVNEPANSPLDLDSPAIMDLLEREYQISKSPRDRHGAAIANLFALALHGLPSLFKPYRDANGKLDLKRICENGNLMKLWGKVLDEAEAKYSERNGMEISAFVEAGATLLDKKDLKDAHEINDYDKTAQDEAHKALQNITLSDSPSTPAAPRSPPKSTTSATESRLIDGWSLPKIDYIFEISKPIEERSDQALMEYIYLLVLDEGDGGVIVEQYGEDPVQRLEYVKDLLPAWAKSGEALPVEQLLEKGLDPSDSAKERLAMALSKNEIPEADPPSKKAIDTPSTKKGTEQNKDKQVTGASAAEKGTEKNKDKTSNGEQGMKVTQPKSKSVTKKGACKKLKKENSRLKFGYAAALKEIARLKAVTIARINSPRTPPYTPPSRQLPPPTETHFVIPDYVPDQPEDMSLAHLELQAPKNETPEGYKNRIRRYKEAVARGRKQQIAKAAWTQDHSVQVEEDDMPTVPVYGKGLEEAINFGGSPPKLHMNNLSMRKIRELQSEKRELENVVLGRREYCGMCDAHINFTSQLHKDNHYRGHRATSAACGFCGISFMSMHDSEKKMHLRLHSNHQYGDRDQIVPYRDLSRALDDGHPKEDIFVFCEDCGHNLNHLVTAAQMKKHADECSWEGQNRSYYCTKCGQGFHDETTRNKHSLECATRHALSENGRDPLIWQFAARNVPVPEGGRATEEAISRTYWQLLTLVGIPGQVDLMSDHQERYCCKFSGCEAGEEKLAYLTKQDKLMEHLGTHLGMQDALKLQCPVDGCGEDFAEWVREDRRNQFDWQPHYDEDAVSLGQDYDHTSLAQRIFDHMWESHDAACNHDKVCRKCKVAEVDAMLGADDSSDDDDDDDEGGEDDEDVVPEEGNEKESQQEKTQRKAREAHQKKDDEKKQREAKEAKEAQKEKDNEASKSDEEVDTEVHVSDQEIDKDEDFIPPEVDEVSDKDDEDADYDDKVTNEKDGGYRKSAQDKGDADALEDKRKGVYKTIPVTWRACIKSITKMKAGDVPGSGAKQLHWVVGCRGCGKDVKYANNALMNHRSFKPDGSEGCGLDDDKELVITTLGHLKYYRETMQKNKRMSEMDPYLTPPPSLDDPKAKEFLWKVWREIVETDPVDADDDADDATKAAIAANEERWNIKNVRQKLLDGSADIETTPKVLQLKDKAGKRVFWDRSPHWRKKMGKKSTLSRRQRKKKLAAAGKKTDDDETDKSDAEEPATTTTTTTVPRPTATAAASTTATAAATATATKDTTPPAPTGRITRAAAKRKSGKITDHFAAVDNSAAKRRKKT